MAKKKRKKKSAEELGTENELLKLKMIAEFGGDFVGGEQLPPEIENQFLKQVMSFHRQHDASKLTTVYKFIGEPEYNHVNDLSDKEVAKELKQLLKLMNKNQVSLSALPEVLPRELYRFITQELFKMEMEDVRVRGWVNQFIYEEFYPNPKHEVRTVIFYSLQSIFNKGHGFFEDNYSEEMKDHIGLSMEVDELREKIENFWSNYNNVQFIGCEYKQLELDKENGTANAICRVSFKTQLEKGKRFKPEEAVLEFNLVRGKMMNWWEIKQIVTDLF